MNRLQRRKLAEKAKSHKGLIFYVAFLLISCISFAFALPVQTMIILGTATIDAQPFDCNTLSATYTETGGWKEGNYTKTPINIKITNSSDIALTNWQMTLGGPYDLDYLYNWQTHYYANENGETFFIPSSSTNIPGNGSFTASGVLSSAKSKITIRYIKINECLVYGDDTLEEEPEPELPTLTGLFITPEEYTMTIGETFTLVATKRPGNAPGTVTWSSSNPTVARVSDTGVVGALNQGTTRITASCEGFTATATITVQKVLSYDDINISFKVNASWGQSMNFVMTIKNNDLVAISHLIFTINLPQNSSYMIWSQNVLRSGNIFTIDETINPGRSKDINGQIDVPSGYNIQNYLNPTITIVEAR